MIIEIQGEGTGGIIMFGKVASTLLKMMGQSGQPEGAVRKEDVAGALSKLNEALDSIPDDEGEAKIADDDDDSVGIKTRALPLVKLLEECVEKGSYVMWKPQ